MPGSRVRRALLFAWAAVVLAVAAPAALRGIAELAGTLAAGWPRPSLAVIAASWAAHARILAAALLPALALWSAGSLPVRWLPGFPAAVRGPAGFLVGAGAVGMAGLGLASVRLFYPGLLILAFVLPAIAGWRTRSPVRLPAGGGAARLATIVALAACIPWMLVPESHPDGWEYFLAGPERMLAAHGLSVLGATPPMHYPAVAEMLYALPVWVDADAAAKILNALALVAGALILSRAVGAGWEGLCLLATAATTAALVASGKNEGFAAGFVMLALAGAWNGRWITSAVAAGFALSTKYLAGLNVAWVPVVCFLPAGRGGVPRLVRWSAVALGVAVPWYAKSYLLTGDPAYPVLSGIWPALQPGWDARNAEVWALCTGGAAWRPGGIGALAIALVREHAALVLVLPLLLAAPGAGRRAAVGGLATLVLWYAFFVPTQLQRWAFPAYAPLFVLAAGAVAAAARSGAVARLLVGAAVGTAWLGALGGRAADPNPLPAALGLETRDSYRARVLTTFKPTRAFMEGKQAPGALLLCGEMREYRLPRPCRLEGAHASGEAPLFWRLTAACTTEAGMARKLRQLGVTRILVNPVLGMTNAPLFIPFAWSDRQLRLHAGFVGRWWDLEFAPPQTDSRNGCAYVYRMRRSPRAVPPAELLHLPGTEGEVLAAVRLAEDGFLPQAVAHLAAYTARMPRVLEYEDTAAWIASHAGDFETAWRLARPGAEPGRLDDENFKTFSVAAYMTRRWTDALRGYELVRAAYPDWAEVADRFSAEARFQMAVERIGRGNARAAESVATEALAAMPPPNRSKWHPRLAGLLHGVRALARFRLGRTGAAREDLAAGAATLPELGPLASPGALEDFLSARARAMLGGK